MTGLRMRTAVSLPFAGAVAVALNVLVVGHPAPAKAAPTGPDSAQDTVNALQAAGYAVVIQKVGQAPLDQCTVTDVRIGQPITRRQTDSTESGDRSVVKVVHSPIFVSVRC